LQSTSDRSFTLHQCLPASAPVQCCSAHTRWVPPQARSAIPCMCLTSTVATTTCVCVHASSDVRVRPPSVSVRKEARVFLRAPACYTARARGRVCEHAVRAAPSYEGEPRPCHRARTCKAHAPPADQSCRVAPPALPRHGPRPTNQPCSSERAGFRAKSGWTRSERSKENPRRPSVTPVPRTAGRHSPHRAGRDRARSGRDKEP
jgi:hypothetical protein